MGRERRGENVSSSKRDGEREGGEEEFYTHPPFPNILGKLLAPLYKAFFWCVCIGGENMGKKRKAGREAEREKETPTGRKSFLSALRDLIFFSTHDGRRRRRRCKRETLPLGKKKCGKKKRRAE